MPTPAVPAAVWLLTAVFAAVLFSYSVAVPFYRAPDEATHIDMVLFAAGDEPWPFTGGHKISRRVSVSFEVVRWTHGDPYDNPPLRRDEAPPRPRPAFAELARDVWSSLGNQQAQHPPLYYNLLAGAHAAGEALTPQPWSFDETAGFLRLVNAAMVLPLPLLIWTTARRLGADPSVGVAAAAVPLGIPVLTHIGAAVNNDNLLVLLVGIATWLTARVLTGDRSPVTAIVLGGVGGLAMLTKGFALFIPLWLLVVYALAAWRAPDRRTALATGEVGVGALALATAVGGMWWLRNLVVLGMIQPSLARPPPADPDFVPSVSEWLAVFVPRLNARFWGELGWRHVSLPEPVMWAATALVAAGILVAAVRRLGVMRHGAAALLVPFAGILPIVVYGSWSHYAGSGVMAGANGRYLFPAVVGVAVAAAAGWAHMLGAWARWLPLAVVAAAGAMQALAVQGVLLRFWGPAEAASERASAAALLAWAPWPPGVVVTVWVATGILVVVLTLLVARDAVRWEHA